MTDLLSNLKSVITSIIIFDLDTKERTIVGYNCRRQSSYNLTNEAKLWFQNIINELRANNAPILSNHYSPPGFDRFMISLMKFNHKIIMFTLSNIDKNYKSELFDVSVLELLSLMCSSIKEKLDIDYLRSFIPDANLEKCEECNTDNTCFPIYAYKLEIA